MIGIQSLLEKIYSHFKEIIQREPKSKSIELTDEIISKILAHVSVKDLKTCQLINRQWRRVTRGLRETTKPLELSHDSLKEIFFWLTAEEVCKLSRVSKAWYKTAAGNDIWEKLCQKEGIAVPSNVKELCSVKTHYFEQTSKLFPSCIKSRHPVKLVKYVNPDKHSSPILKVVFCVGEIIVFGYEKHLIVKDLKKNKILNFSINPDNEKDSLEHFEVFDNIIAVKFDGNTALNSHQYGIKCFDMNGKLLYRKIVSPSVDLFFKILDSKLVVYCKWTIHKMKTILNFFDLKTGKELETFEIGLIQRGFYFLEDSIVSATCSKVSVWSKNTGKLLRSFCQLENYSFGIKKFQIKDGVIACYHSKIFYKGYFEQELLKIWDLKTGKCIQTFEIGFGKESWNLFKLVKEHLLVDKSTEKETRIDVLEIATKKCIKTLTAKQKNKNKRIKSLQVFLNLVIAVKEDEVILWKLNTKLGEESLSNNPKHPSQNP